MLAHVGTLNSARSAFSTFHTAFIRAKPFSCYINFFSFANNPWAGLGRILAVACATDRKTLISTMSTFSCFRGKAFLGKPATITFGENKDVNSWIKLRLTVDFTTILLRQPSEELVPWEQTPEHHGIDPNMLDSGHHDCSKKAVFLCTAVKLQSCHMLAH